MPGLDYAYIETVGNITEYAHHRKFGYPEGKGAYCEGGKGFGHINGGGAQNGRRLTM